MCTIFGTGTRITVWTDLILHHPNFRHSFVEGCYVKAALKTNGLSNDTEQSPSCDIDPICMQNPAANSVADRFHGIKHGKLEYLDCTFTFSWQRFNPRQMKRYGLLLSVSRCTVYAVL